MYLTSLIHRDDLFDITVRWLNDEPKEGDCRLLSEIFLFESATSAPIVQDIMLGIFGKLYGDGISVERVRQKDKLRARIIEGIDVYDERLRCIVEAYHASPEEFFPGTPVDAILMSTPTRSLVSISRIKRPSRVAEKAAFRLIDSLADRIRHEAKAFASARASALGLALESLISSEQQMDDDFVAAENVVAKAFRNGSVVFDRSQITINDIIGFKIVGDESELRLAEQTLAQEPGVAVIERQEHQGRYNATNILVDIELPPVGRIIDDNADRDWHQAVERGLDPSVAPKRFAEYVESGARAVRTEIILTTYPELVESELGRSIHEQRVLRLRDRQSYSGQIALNARYLIEYLIAVAYSPSIEVKALPIKLWGRYLPDTVLTAVGELFGYRENGLLKWFLPFLGGVSP